jgi:GPH family glycoside/pentoside/hexuronide:cation symporter
MGVGLASVFMLPWGLLADVVDFAEFRHRERREAALFAAFLVIVKASAVASVGFIGWAMAELHYVPGVKQSLPVQTGVQFLALGMPFLGSLMSVSLICFLPITHRRHGLVLKQLERRRSELSRSMGLTRSAARDLPA